MNESPPRDPFQAINSDKLIFNKFNKIPIHDFLAQPHCDTTVAMMLVGNKCDLDNIRDVSIEEGKSLAESEGLFFMETSALDSPNVKTAFEMVVREIFNNVSRKVLLPRY